MAWEISITADGWQQLRNKLKDCDRASLIEALTDDTFERVYEHAGEHHAQRAADAEWERLDELPHDVLAERAFELVEQNNTCDDDGFACWIDREGYHKV